MSIASYRWKAIQKGFTTIHTSTTNLSQRLQTGKDKLNIWLSLLWDAFELS